MDDAREESAAAAPDQSFRFSTRTLLWATALLCVGMGTFGPPLGIYFCLLVFLAYACVRATLLNWKSGLKILAYGVLFHLLVAMLLPAVSSAKPAAYRNQSLNNLKQNLLAILNFESATGRLPLPYTADEQNQVLHSWRTLMLPYVEEIALHDSIDHDAPWNDAANRELLTNRSVWCFKSEREAARYGPKDETQYFAVVDERTVWRPGEAVRLEEITDGLANTIALIEVAGRGVRWYEPRDLTFDEAVDLLVGVEDERQEWLRPESFWTSTRVPGDGLFPRLVAFMDGHVEVIGFVPDRETAAALLTRSGGEDLTDWHDRVVHHPKALGLAYVIHWDRVFGTGLFLVLALAPLVKTRGTDG